MQHIGYHLRIIQFYGICRHNNQLHIVTEYVNYGSLWDLLFGNNKDRFENILKIELKLDMMIQACDGIIYLHKQAVIHRDISARNFLIDSNFNIKIADFGLARLKMTHESHLHDSNPNPNQSPSIQAIKSPGQHGHGHGQQQLIKFGPIRWMAPESLYGDELQYDEKTDCYSFGITLYEIFAIKRPYYDIKTLQNVVIAVFNNKRPLIDNDININKIGIKLINLMKLCWNNNPLIRPKFNNIKIKLNDIKKEYQINNNITINTKLNINNYNTNSNSSNINSNNNSNNNNSKEKNKLHHNVSGTSEYDLVPV